MKKKIIIALIFVLCVSLFGRIYYVNATAPQEKYEYYKIGEWVEYDGAFFNNIKENTQGYAVRVVSAEKISFNDYIKKYNIDTTNIMVEYEYVVDMKMEYKNKTSEDGYIALTEVKMFAENDNTYYYINPMLLSEDNSKMAGNMELAFKLRPNNEVVSVNLPFVLPVRSNGYVDKDNNKNPKQLIITTTPIKKVILIDL